jgi:hypothetical protein
MTAAGIRRQSPGAAAARELVRPAAALLRTGWLYALSRRIPAALGLIVAAAALLWAAMYWRWNIVGGAAAQQFIPLTTEATAAAVIATTTYGPFGETERATGRWLPYLRLGMTVALTAAAVGALAAGAAGGHVPGGTLVMLRNVAGLTGTGLLVAAAIGGAFGWIGPLAYLIVTEGAFAGSWTTPWIWPTRPPHDLGGALCAAGVFAAGTILITVRGERNHAAS